MADCLILDLVTLKKVFKMNFGEVIKEEIKNKQIKDNHCKKAFLAGLMRSSGLLFSENDKIGLLFKAPDENVAMICSEFLKSIFNYEVREVAVSTKDKFTISLTGSLVSNILEQLGILKQKHNSKEEYQVEFGFYDVVAKKECCFKSFLRGLFVGAGSCTIPDTVGGKTGYHLELNFSHSKPASETINRLNEYGIYPKITRKKDSYMLYIKSAEEIKDFLAFLGVPVSVLKLTDVIIERELLNNSNRVKNCDLGNVAKQVEASAKYLQAIIKIEKSIGFENLKQDLLDVAIARKNFPEDTLSELANRLNLSKSCLNHRLRKILLIANSIEK